VTPNLGFKITVNLQVEYLKKGVSYRDKALIGNQTQSIEWYHFQ